MQPYQTDYALVVDEIVKRTTGRQRLDSDVEKDIFSSRRQDFTEEVSLMQQLETYDAQIQNLADNISNVEEVLKRLNQYIANGLDVSVTGDNRIKVSAGYGVAYGMIQSLTIYQEVTITFDDDTPAYYIQINDNTVVINKVNNVRMLTVGKIIVPYPGKTSAIQDDKPSEVYGVDTGYNGWVESAKDVFFGEDTVFDDASREVVRDALSQIAGEIIFGTLTASESLKITNVHGTAELTSRAMIFKNSDGEIVSYYGSDYARIGDIAVYPTYLASTNYISEFSGFLIDKSGYAEFEDVRIRGRLSSSVFEYDKISAAGGKLLVSGASVLAKDMTSSSTTITVEDAVFEIDEVVRIKDGVSDEHMLIRDDASAPIYTVTRDLAFSYGGSSPLWSKGIAVVSMGKGGEGDLSGYVILDAESRNSPFLDVMYRNSTVYNDVTLKARFGNLEGIGDLNFGALSGFGLYTTNAYIKGSIYSSMICLVDPNCTDCYSYLSAGTLRFHHPYGSIPYAKRIESGTADAGDTICLHQWYTTPKVITSINRMKSYDSGRAASDQEWCVYYDNLQSYSNPADESDFGYCFDIHSKLVVSGGTEDEVVHNVNFDVMCKTHANTLCSLVKLRFELWCHGVAPSNWCYGCICYDVCYRKDVAGPPVWCCCQYTYAQAHSTTNEMCCTCTVSHLVDLGAGSVYQIAIHETGFGWYDSGLASGSTAYCCVSCNASDCQLHCVCARSTMPAEDSDSCIECICFGASPENVYCSIMSYFLCIKGRADSNNVGQCEYICYAHKDCDGGTPWNCILWVYDFTNCYYAWSGNKSVVCAAYQCCFCMLGCVWVKKYGCAEICGQPTYNCWYICDICQITCYCDVSGNAGNCCYRNFYSTTDTTGAETILDADGIVNWLAIAYA